MPLKGDVCVTMPIGCWFLIMSTTPRRASCTGELLFDTEFLIKLLCDESLEFSLTSCSRGLVTVVGLCVEFGIPDMLLSPMRLLELLSSRTSVLRLSGRMSCKLEEDLLVSMGLATILDGGGIITSADVPWLLDCELHNITGVTGDAAVTGGGLGSFFRTSGLAVGTAADATG